MRSTTSSIGPGIGANPSAASQRSGRGMRESVAAIPTARRVRLRNRSTRRGVYERLAVKSQPEACAKHASPNYEPGRGRGCTRDSSAGRSLSCSIGQGRCGRRGRIGHDWVSSDDDAQQPIGGRASTRGAAPQPGVVDAGWGRRGAAARAWTEGRSPIRAASSASALAPLALVVLCWQHTSWKRVITPLPRSPRRGGQERTRREEALLLATEHTPLRCESGCQAPAIGHPTRGACQGPVAWSLRVPSPTRTAVRRAPGEQRPRPHLRRSPPRGQP